MPASWPDRARAASRRAGPAPWILFAFALLVRGLYLCHIERCPYFDFMPDVFDQHNFYAGAKAFAQGDLWAPSANEMYSALYKYALGVVWWAAGGGDPSADEYPIFLAARATHLLFGAIASLILYFEASRYFSRRVGILSSVLYTLCGPVLFHEALLSREYPATWLSLAAFAALGRLHRRPSWASLLLSAGLLSLAYQCRTNAIVFAPAAAFFAYRVALARLPAGQRLVRIGAAGLFFAVLCLPLAWRTSKRLPITNPPPPGTERNAFTVSAQGPFEVALGNHPDLVAPGYRPPQEALDFMEKGPLTMTEAARRIWGWIRADPGGFALLYLRKIYWFFSDYEVPDNQCFYVWRFYSALLDLPTSHAALYAALAIPGAVLAWRERRRLLLLYLFAAAAAAAVVLTYVCSRFRVQAIPFWIPFAAFAIDRFWDSLRGRRIASALAVAVAAAGLARLFWLPEPDGVLRRLGIAERHFPESADGTVRIAHPERGEAREIPYAQTGASRLLDHMNLAETHLAQLGRAEADPGTRPGRAALFRHDAEVALRRLWRRAESMRDARMLPFEKLAMVYAFQWNDAVRSGDAARMLRIGEKWLRLQPDQPPLRKQAAALAYQALIEGPSVDPAGIRRAESHAAAGLWLDPASGDLWAALAHLACMRRDAPAARFHAETLAARAPGHPALPALLERIPERTGEELEPEAFRAAKALEAEGDALSASGKKREAVERYDAALRLAFGDRTIRHKRAAILARPAPEEAVRDYEILLILDPDDPEAGYALARAIGDAEPMRAVMHLRRVLAVAPDHPLGGKMKRAESLLPTRFRPE